MTKLLKKIIYTGNLVVKTGLHIGGTNASLNIGGPDKFVVRNPLTNIPYIPGSSLKGKLRSLLELKNGETSNGKPSNNVRSKAGALFGVAGDNEQSHPSRLIVRDAEMATDADTEEELQNTDCRAKCSPTTATPTCPSPRARPRCLSIASQQNRTHAPLNVCQQGRSLKFSLCSMCLTTTTRTS